ncbi:MAG TPA: hypothetical protein VF806_06880, partial [Anaerolineaceae bacterium]
VLVITTFFLLLNQNWRWNIIALSVQYLAVFTLVALVWPVGLAAVKLVAGWMAGAVLGASQPPADLSEDPQAVGPVFIFRFMVAILVWALVYALTPILAKLIALPPALVTGSILLVGMGLVNLGMTTRPLRVLLGLLTTLSGFELIYAAVENSVLVAGLLAVVTLGLALVGAYLLDTLSNEESSEPEQAAEERTGL